MSRLGRPSWLRMAWRLRKAPRGIPTPSKLLARSTFTIVPTSMMEAAFGISRHAPFDLKELAALRTSSLVGCPW